MVFRFYFIIISFNIDNSVILKNILGVVAVAAAAADAITVADVSEA